MPDVVAAAIQMDAPVGAVGANLAHAAALVEQAAASFELWHGVRPQTDAIYTQLRMGSALAG